MTQQQTNIQKTKQCHYTRERISKILNVIVEIQVPHCIQVHYCLGQRASFGRGQLLQWIWMEQHFENE
jgi:hypothetical protein